MTTPYGQQPPGQQPPPGSGPPPGDGQQQSPQSQQPFGQPPSGEQPSPFGQQPQQGDQPSPFGQPQSSPFGQQGGHQPPFGQQGQQSPFGQPAGGPPPFGQAPPAQFGQASPYGPMPNAYAHWGKRLAAMLIDFSPILLVYLIGGIYYLVTKSEASIALGIAGIVFIGFSIWNRWILMGTTGQSLGKRYLKIKLVKETTGEPLGIGLTIAREFCHFLDNALCGLGYWWPLWDQKRQTFADKILTTVVLPVDAEVPAAQPFGGQPGFPAQPTPFGQPQQPQSGAFGQPQPQQPSQPFGQQPQQPFGQPQQAQQQPFGQQPQPPAFGQQPQGTPVPSSESETEPGFGEAEPTQVLHPGSGQQAPSGFDEAEPTQKITPEQLRQQLPGADGPNQPGPPHQ
ncbi:RDD family protein [Amycolatopsis pittospori]|uniref:RDD family protein n=1 Tax=Amycolatopsis pittospori TaxID=2749434 RepID=UPI0015F07E78|nr:RDD family protein [Amycolatopsis pittospori]